MARPESGEGGAGWPGWAKLGVSALLVLHGTAVVAAVLAASPSSGLQRAVADQFRWYYQLLDQGYTYRFYTAGAPPTPILFAELEFEDGRSEEIRVPDRSQAPRLRFQRHLAIAYHLFEDVRRAPRDPDTGDSRSRWAASYARHLCREHPGCRRVTLFLQDHLNPSPRELVEAAREGRTIDVEDPRYYGDRLRIGAYSCDD
ncbi:hypothetical protein [Tautonia sociabilis]|uniref:Uncharacterized protein n=1 Tax=Tautonia sociabilis TaxID=2080755 RepID=A0A432MH29_9BACT|nr:hypothetical protein [Tautonia sociabilis]RUL86277.1 hypothetical protein TsocGM_16215 [Tautonia sociabilis]